MRQVRYVLLYGCLLALSLLSGYSLDYTEHCIGGTIPSQVRGHLVPIALLVVLEDLTKRKRG